MRSLGLFAQGGREIGLGHVMRTTSLAREARRLGLEPTLWIEGDEAARQAARREAGETPVNDPGAVSDVPASADAWILDGPGKLEAFLEMAEALDRRTIVLDRLDLIDRATWTVLPVLHAPASQDRRVRQGADWCIVDPWLRGRRADEHAARDGLLVVFGGADPEGLLLRLAEACRTEAPCGVTPRFVIGPAAPAGRVRALARLGFSPDDDDRSVLVAPNRDELYAAMAEARVAICGFGLCLYELAALGTPAFCVTRSAADADAAERLAALGIGRPLGSAEAFDASHFVSTVRDVLAEGGSESAARSAIAALGDGGGPRRILELALEGSAR